MMDARFSYCVCVCVCVCNDNVIIVNHPSSGYVQKKVQI